MQKLLEKVLQIKDINNLFKILAHNIKILDEIFL